MSNRAWTLFAVVLASGIVFLDSTVLSVALERMGRELTTALMASVPKRSTAREGSAAGRSAP